ncbi:hypothetical protein [Photobacterium minamisatsumaniensis]|uniref:hypothetical protein n=1 Tax=Photobacterium minamisatsumaniensis TaxID=2910233 RepID=UPI003D0E00DF
MIDNHPKLLIADTTDILEAFVENGLHRHYSIYCQFPHCDTVTDKLAVTKDTIEIEFNDGYIFSIKN